MTSQTQPETWYTQRLEATDSELSKTNAHIRNISIVRLFLFSICLVTVFLLWEQNTIVILGGASCSFIPFLLLVKIHNRFFKQKQWLETQGMLIRRELKALKNDYSEFEEGKEFIQPDHLYSYDLDLFGKNSLFQAINRTCTQIGKETLATWMKEHLRSKEAIQERQACIRELTNRTDFREKFMVTGQMHPSQKEDEEAIKDWSKKEANLSNVWWVRWLIWGVPAINILLIAGGLSGLFSLSWFGFSFFFFIILSFSVVQKATVLQEEYALKMKTLSSYAKLISLIEEQPYESIEMKSLIASLRINGDSPTKALKELSKELDRLDIRNNQLLYVLLEGSIFFQLHQLVRIERWKLTYGKQLPHWLDIVGQLDALCSLSTFAFNHPQYVYPDISDQPFCFHAKEMGHPLMPADQCVTNDAEIASSPFFLIITGANMAGKSTYLRTIGTNYLLACIGAPVCCKELKLYPSQLVTSLRTSDSLTENESYFFAELKRLKRIIDLLHQGENLFIILDEILKGTNSVDKQKGSYHLIRQLLGLNACGIIATHDLLLGELIKQFPTEIRNFCFEADIIDNELSFSYKIREGIAQNMNACFLMKKMGIAF